MMPNNSQFNQPPVNPGAPQPAQNPAGVFQAPQPQTMQQQQPNFQPPQPQQYAQPMQPGVPAQPAVAFQQPLAPQQVAGSPQPSVQAPKNPNSTQNTLQFSEVRDGMVIMNDGSVRAVIACKSINFDLMSDREREGVEYSYQNFLNSLNFPVQILVRSQRVDIAPYIDKLIAIRRTQDNMLLGVLMDDYVNFIDALAEEANIMEKSFYIVVPYFPAGDAANLVNQSKGFFGKLFGKDTNAVTHIDGVAYQKAKDEIRNRVDSVIAGLFQMGIQAGQLNTKALGELYYNYYNPDTAVRQPLGNFDAIATTFVKRGTGVPPQGGAQ